MWMRAAIGVTLALTFMGEMALAKEALAGPPWQTPSLKATQAAATCAARRDKARLATRGRTQRKKRETEQLPPPDEYIGAVSVVGQREVGRAAWYGGRHIGRRTASGGRLDAVHATAAHRTLPLDSLVRVTNLSNGRAVIAKITDRGPVSRSLLIDVSPAVADKLDMRHAGLADVAVEVVVPAAKTPQ
jgi:rare lipoprotein A (peptidoglycan hydrolase)